MKKTTAIKSTKDNKSSKDTKGTKRPKPAITAEPKQITNLIIIDASGSMGSKIPEVKGGLKELFKQIKADAAKDKGKIEQNNIILDFSSHGDTRFLVESTNPDLLADSLADSYRTRGATALFDAIGKGFEKVPQDKQTVFVTIITDGEENDSKEFSYKAVQSLITSKKTLGWTITFMGTTEASLAQARSWGISMGNTMAFEDGAEGVSKAMNKMSNTRSAYYSGASASLSAGQNFQSDNMFDDQKVNEGLEKIKEKYKDKDLADPNTVKDALKDQKGLLKDNMKDLNKLNKVNNNDKI